MKKARLSDKELAALVVRQIILDHTPAYLGKAEWEKLAGYQDQPQAALALLRSKVPHWDELVKDYAAVLQASLAKAGDQKPAEKGSHG